jgi:hypothetical protein
MGTNSTAQFKIFHYLLSYEKEKSEIQGILLKVSNIFLIMKVIEIRNKIYYELYDLKSHNIAILPDSYWCKTLFLNVTEEDEFSKFDKNVLRKTFRCIINGKRRMDITL